MPLLDFNCILLQLRAARYEVYDIFFSLSAGERMRLISWDRDLARERELRRQVAFSVLANYFLFIDFPWRGMGWMVFHIFLHDRYKIYVSIVENNLWSVMICYSN